MGSLVWVLEIFCVVGLFFSIFWSGGFLCFWFVLEVMGLSVMPFFFVGGGVVSSRALFNFFVVSGLSSFFFVVGGYLGSFGLWLILLSVFVKLGLFPFMGWAYEVVVYSNWLLVWGFSCLLKVPFIILLYLPEMGLKEEVCVCLLSVVSFLMLSVLFWSSRQSLKACWCGMMLSGCGVLLVSSLYGSGGVVMLNYLVYLVWASFVVAFMSRLGEVSSLGLFNASVFVFLLIPFPLSLSFFYKLASLLSLMGAPAWVLGSWVTYSISEQAYLVYFLVSQKKFRSGVGVFGWL